MSKKSNKRENKVKALCISALPSAGLGNKLFSWAAGALSAHLNKCPHYITGLTRLHFGTILRREKSWRFYRGYFCNETTKLKSKLIRKGKKFMLTQQQAADIRGESGTFVFNEIPHWSDQFHVLRDHRSIIVDLFWNNLTRKVTSRIEQHRLPIIGVHVRCGDFRKLQNNEDFSKVGSVRTPMDYFLQTIQKVRQAIGQNAEAIIFSDGSDEDIRPLLNLPNVSRAKPDLDIVHLCSLSKSKVLIMSAGSTFSHWAGSLSEGALIVHYQHIHAPIRSIEINKKVYEGGLPLEKNVTDYPYYLKTYKLWLRA